MLRPTSSLVTFWAASGLVALLFGDAVLRGAWGIVAHWLPLALLVVWALWVVLWRTSVRWDPQRLVVVNGVRVHRMPWAEVAEVRGGAQLRVELRDGRTVTCLGSPFPSKTGAGMPLGDAVATLEAARESAGACDEPATVEWDLPSLAVGVILLVATGLSLAFVR